MSLWRDPSRKTDRIVIGSMECRRLDSTTVRPGGVNLTPGPIGAWLDSSGASVKESAAVGLPATVINDRALLSSPSKRGFVLG